MTAGANFPPSHRGTAIVMHRSIRLREATRIVLEHAGFVVLVAGDVPSVCQAVKSGCRTPVVALMEYEMGDAATPWRSLKGELPRAIRVFGLLEAVGPADTPEVTLVTRGEREVHGPMPMADLPAVLSWVTASDQGSTPPIQSGGRYPQF